MTGSPVSRESEYCTGMSANNEPSKIGGVAYPAIADLNDVLAQPVRVGWEGLSRSIAEQLSAAHNSLTASLGRASIPASELALGEVMKGIDAQYSQLAEIMKPAAALSFEVPSDLRPQPILNPPKFDDYFVENPTHETNKKLARIEKRFKNMEEIALQGAKIATDLQAYAATFLTQFQAAAKSTERGGKYALWVGITAVLISVGIPIYEATVKAPADATAMQAIVSDLKQEVVDLKASQAALITALDTSLGKSDAASSAVLSDIRDLLRPKPTFSLPKPWPQPRGPK